MQDLAPCFAADFSIDDARRYAVTTRDDSTDLGVPMLQGSPDEPVGPDLARSLGAYREWDRAGQGECQGPLAAAGDRLDFLEDVRGKQNRLALPQAADRLPPATA